LENYFKLWVIYYTRFPSRPFSALFENRNSLFSIHLLINMIPWMLQETFI
jgi:hypothetical protein